MSLRFALSLTVAMLLVTTAVPPTMAAGPPSGVTSASPTPLAGPTVEDSIERLEMRVAELGHADAPPLVEAMRAMVIHHGFPALEEEVAMWAAMEHSHPRLARLLAGLAMVAMEQPSKAIPYDATASGRAASTSSSTDQVPHLPCTLTWSVPECDLYCALNYYCLGVYPVQLYPPAGPPCQSTNFGGLNYLLHIGYLLPLLIIYGALSAAFSPTSVYGTALGIAFIAVFAPLSVAMGLVYNFNCTWETIYWTEEFLLGIRVPLPCDC